MLLRARASHPVLPAALGSFFLSFFFFFPPFSFFLRVARSRQSPLERNHPRWDTSYFLFFVGSKNLPPTRRASILEGSLMKDRRIVPGFEGVSSSSPLSTDDIVISMISRLEVAWWIRTDLQGQPLPLLFFFFHFLAQPMEGVVREGSRVEGLDSLRRYVKSKNASLRRGTIVPWSNPSSGSVLRPLSSRDSLFFPSFSSSSPGRNRFADPFDG